AQSVCIFLARNDGREQRVLCAEISVADISEVSQDGAEGTELFAGFELADITEAERLFATGRDRNGNFFSLATWAVLGYFLTAYRS
ncbi:MAG: hypothetical protein II483_09755, partial [Lachnospiraceae bacterium]|nr:hypothetical protein [Lachnospiraceae bacterium]